MEKNKFTASSTAVAAGAGEPDVGETDVGEPGAQMAANTAAAQTAAHPDDSAQILPFSEFFKSASDAYYRRAKIGEDFITAVSCGPLFGACIAAYARQIAAQRWPGEDVAVIEFGAAGGELMNDFIAAAEAPQIPAAEAPQSHVASSPQIPAAPATATHASNKFSYFISEPKAELRARQSALLGAKISHIDDDFTAPRAVIFANELFDALPFELFINAQRMGISSDFELAAMPKTAPFCPPCGLAALTPANGELATGVAEFLADISRRFERFSLLAFDYACASADAISARVFASHRAPLCIADADLAALAAGAADITYTPAMDQIRTICAALGLECKTRRQAAWLIDAQAAQIAQQSGQISALKRLCFGFGENFFVYEITR